MCNLYSMTKNVDAIHQLLHDRSTSDGGEQPITVFNERRTIERVRGSQGYQNFWNPGGSRQDPDEAAKSRLPG
jgi:hypothetical protein